MPIYDYECKKCKHADEYITGMNDLQSCPKCGTAMTRLLHSRYGICMGAAGASGYYDENLGKYIGTNRQRREEMLKQGVTERGGTPKTGQAWL